MALREFSQAQEAGVTCLLLEATVARMDPEPGSAEWEVYGIYGSSSWARQWAWMAGA